MKTPKFAVLIPARLDSVRLPRKLLLEVEGKSVLQWTWESAITSMAAYVAIVTGDGEIADVAAKFGANVIRSKHEHDSGTSRIAEAVSSVPPGIDTIINLQGDEPCLGSFWPMKMAEKLALEFSWPGGINICTLACKLPAANAAKESVVKVAVSATERALWFSRAPMAGTMQHVGIYGFRRQHLSVLPKRTPLAAAENLEQLSWLEHGYKIGVLEIDAPTIAIDTVQDFVEFKAWARRR